MVSSSYKVLSKFCGPNGRQYRAPIYLGCFHFAALANELVAMTITVGIKCCILINKAWMQLDESKQANEEKRHVTPWNPLMPICTMMSLPHQLLQHQGI